MVPRSAEAKPEPSGVISETFRNGVTAEVFPLSPEESLRGVAPGRISFGPESQRLEYEMISAYSAAEREVIARFSPSAHQTFLRTRARILGLMARYLEGRAGRLGLGVGMAMGDVAVHFKKKQPSKEEAELIRRLSSEERRREMVLQVLRAIDQKLVTDAEFVSGAEEYGVTIMPRVGLGVMGGRHTIFGKERSVGLLGGLSLGLNLGYSRSHDAIVVEFFAQFDRGVGGYGFEFSPAINLFAYLANTELNRSSFQEGSMFAPPLPLFFNEVRGYKGAGVPVFPPPGINPSDYTTFNIRYSASRQTFIRYESSKPRGYMTFSAAGAEILHVAWRRGFEETRVLGKTVRGGHARRCFALATGS
jgi:hypothetical protein